MNYITALVLTIALLAQLVSCSKATYKVVCKTEYSYVLKQFNSAASDFQTKLGAINACLDPMENDRIGCLENIKISDLYHRNVLNLDSDVFSLTAYNINELHQKACKALNEEAKDQEYAKDIEHNEYDILNDSKSIKNLLGTIEIGIKIKSGQKQSKVLRETTMLFKRHFEDIKKILNGKADEVESKAARVISDNLSSIFPPLRNLIHSMGGFHQVDDIDLIIAINRCLNRFAVYVNDEEDLSDSDLNLNENEESDSDEDLDSKLKIKGKKWFWVKVGAGIFAVAVLAGLVILYLRSSAVHEDKDADIEA